MTSDANVACLGCCVASDATFLCSRFAIPHHPLGQLSRGLVERLMAFPISEHMAQVPALVPTWHGTAVVVPLVLVCVALLLESRGISHEMLTPPSNKRLAILLAFELSRMLFGGSKRWKRKRLGAGGACEAEVEELEETRSAVSGIRSTPESPPIGPQRCGS